MNTTAKCMASLGLCALAGCGGVTLFVGAQPDMARVVEGSSDMREPEPDMTQPFEDAVVYAHTADTLYRIDPDNLRVTRIGTFDFDNPDEMMTDVAVDRDGHIVGISFDNVFRVDSATAKATFLSKIDRVLTSLSYLNNPSAPNEPELLIAAGNDGTVYEIDPMTGASRMIGAYGNGVGSSGDLVSVEMLGTIATVHRDGHDTDWLAKIDPADGKATLIGDTGHKSIWGLGFWRDKVFGFSETDGFLLIDAKTARTEPVKADVEIPWWGAGVTTRAPVIIF